MSAYVFILNLLNKLRGKAIKHLATYHISLNLSHFRCEKVSILS